MNFFRTRPSSLSMTKHTAAAALTLGLVGGASADVVSGESAGFGLQVDASVLDILSVDVLAGTPAQHSQGTAPAAYDHGSGLVTLDVDAGVNIPAVASLNLLAADGVLTSTASSDIDGSTGPKTANGFGQVNGLNLNLADVDTLLSNTPALVSITADTINATASVAGDAGSMTWAGASVIQNLAIAVNGVNLNLLDLLGASASVDVNGFLAVAPNTTLLNLGGIADLNLTLNQQIVTGEGTNDLGVEVNALRLTASGVDIGLSGLLTADVQIAHAGASMSAVPEPASLALLGLGGIAMVGRRRREA